VHHEVEAVVFSVKSGLNVVAIANNGTIFVGNLFIGVTVGLKDSRPEIGDSLGGALDGLNVARLVNFDVSELLVLQLTLTEGVLL